MSITQDPPIGITPAQLWAHSDKQLRVPIVEQIADEVTLTSHGNANTKGLYVELDASTGGAVSGIVLILRETTAVGAPKKFKIDIATGAAGSETVIIANILHYLTSNLSTAFLRFNVHIAAGIRISARCEDNAGAGTITVSAWLERS